MCFSAVYKFETSSNEDATTRTQRNKRSLALFFFSLFLNGSIPERTTRKLFREVTPLLGCYYGDLAR